MEMYQFMGEMLKKWHKGLGIYLCMESEEIWRKSQGWSPGNSEGLSLYLDERVRKAFI
jgi:spore photoproduct lyase